ncbi:MAG: ABC transporter permease subunit [Methanospirillum sp.]
MDLYRLRVIGGKELLDHLMDRRFLLIAGILLLVVVIGLIGGLISYGESLSQYANAVEVVGESTTTQQGSAQGASLLVILDAIATEIVVLGSILGIAMGFDLITKEKEGGSLKLLLSHPIFRDEVINGKGLGGIAAIALVVVVTFIILLGILFLFGIVPNEVEAFSILVLAVTTFLLIFSYFSISLLMSAVSPTGGTALIASLIIFIFLSSLMPMFVDASVVGLFIGKAPAAPNSGGASSFSAQGAQDKSGMDDGGSIVSGFSISDVVKYQKELRAFEEKRMALEGVISLFSPTLNYQQVSTKLTGRTTSKPQSLTGDAALATRKAEETSGETSTIPRILETVLPNIVALLIFPTIFFGIAYARFMRLDIR